MAPLLSQNNRMGASILGTTSSSVMNFFIQTASLAASAAAIYSASVVESAIVACLEFLQLTAPPLSMNTNPDTDLLSSGSDWKLESVKALSCRSPPPYSRKRSLDLLKYLRIHFTAAQCCCNAP